MEKLRQGNEIISEASKANLNSLKDEFNRIHELLTNENAVQQLQTCIRQRKAKRKRVYKQKMRKRLDRLVRDNEIQQKHREIDENLEKMQQDVKDEEAVSA